MSPESPFDETTKPDTDDLDTPAMTTYPVDDATYRWIAEAVGEVHR